MVKTIFPIVRLDDKKSWCVTNNPSVKGIIIRIQDLVSKTTGNPNSTFYRIQSAKGIHNFLNYNGVVVLSSVMRDDIIFMFNPKKYSEIIKGILPDFYTTVDGATYEEYESLSLREIKRISQETLELMQLCPEVTPIGLVKGRNIYQIKFHYNFLKNLGIKIFMFHTGDFFRNGSPNMIKKAKHFCSLIKRPDNVLLLHGMGSQNKILEFSFADIYITYNHFIIARNGCYLSGTKKQKYANKTASDVAVDNLNQMFKNLESLKNQTKLFDGGRCLWVADILEQELVLH